MSENDKQPGDAMDGRAVLQFIERRIQTFTQQLEGERVTRRVLVGQAEEVREAIADRDATIAHLQGQLDEARAMHAAFQPQHVGPTA